MELEISYMGKPQKQYKRAAKHMLRATYSSLESFISPIVEDLATDMRLTLYDLEKGTTLRKQWRSKQASAQAQLFKQQYGL